MNLFSHDKTKDYDYKIQLLAISKNRSIAKIEKIVLLGCLEKENVIKLYDKFKPTINCKYPCLKTRHLKPVSEIFNKIKNDKNEITSISIGKDYIEKAKEFSKLLVEKGIISKKDYNNNNLSLEENKYNNSVQGKFAEMAFYDFLKSKNIATKKDWNDMLTVLDINYDFGDFRLPDNKIIDVKSYTYFSENDPVFPFEISHLTKDIDYFVFSVINGIQETKYDKKDFNKNEYKVDFYGFIDKYKIKTLIKESKIKIIHNSKNNEFCLIPWKYMKPIIEIYQP